MGNEKTICSLTRNYTECGMDVAMEFHHTIGAFLERCDKEYDLDFVDLEELLHREITMLIAYQKKL